MGIEAVLWVRSNVKISDQQGLGVLKELAIREVNGICEATLTSIAEACGKARSTTYQHIEILAQQGHIRVFERKNTRGAKLPDGYLIAGYCPAPDDLEEAFRCSTVRGKVFDSTTEVYDHATPDPSQMSALELVEHYKTQMEAPQEEQDPSIVPELIGVWNTHCGALPKVEQPSDYVVGALGRMVEGMGIEKAKKKLELATLELARFPHPSFSLDHALKNKKYETLGAKYVKRLREQQFRKVA